MTGAAQSLARRARRALLIRRAAEAGAGAAAAGLAVGLAARLEGWAAPGAAAAAAAIAALAAFWAAARTHFQLAAALSPEADEDALLRSALTSSSQDAEWRELLASAAGGRRPAFEPAGEWIPAAMLALMAVFALAWQDSRPRYAPLLTSPAAAGAASAAAAPAADPAAALRPETSQAAALAGDGEEHPARGEWRTLEPAAPSGSILLPPGAAARERSAIERYLRLRAAAAE